MFAREGFNKAEIFDMDIGGLLLQIPSLTVEADAFQRFNRAHQTYR